MNPRRLTWTDPGTRDIMQTRDELMAMSKRELTEMAASKGIPTTPRDNKGTLADKILASVPAPSPAPAKVFTGPAPTQAPPAPAPKPASAPKTPAGVDVVVRLAGRIMMNLSDVIGPLPEGAEVTETASPGPNGTTVQVKSVLLRHDMKLRITPEAFARLGNSVARV